MDKNPLRIRGIEFLEFAGANTDNIERVFGRLGIPEVAKHKQRPVKLFQEHDVRFLLTTGTQGFAGQFTQAHGPAIATMGLRVDDAAWAQAEAVRRGARAFTGEADKFAAKPFPAIYGIGDSLVYFIDRFADRGDIYSDNFNFLPAPPVKKNPLLRIDHLTNNVPRGEMLKWCEFYASIFGFIEARHFDIKGLKTGLVSKVMCLEDRSVMIPINEPTDDKSQIQEYLLEYRGSGIQHVAISTANIIDTVAGMRDRGLDFLETPSTYYEMVKSRLPALEEDVNRLSELKLLADGDPKGYLLQIFTKNVIGPIFFEIIQRKNHWGFGEGNFQALFDAIERDQVARGFLK